MRGILISIILAIGTSIFAQNCTICIENGSVDFVSLPDPDYIKLDVVAPDGSRTSNFDQSGTVIVDQTGVYLLEFITSCDTITSVVEVNNCPCGNFSTQLSLVNGCLITVTNANGAPPYSYMWSDGSSNSSLETMDNSQSYSVTVTDDRGCTTSASLNSNACVFDVQILPNGSCPEEITWSSSGDCSNYSGLVTFNSTTLVNLSSNANGTYALNDYSAGVYEISYSDASGTCQDFNTIYTHDPPMVMETIVDESCNDDGSMDGSISLTVNGNAPITYVWSTGGTTSSIINLSAGLYSVTVTSDTGCFVEEFTVGDLDDCCTPPFDLALTTQSGGLFSGSSYSLNDLDQVEGTICSSPFTFYTNIGGGQIPVGDSYSVAVSGDVTLISSANQTSSGTDVIDLEFFNTESGSSTLTVTYCGQDYVWNFVHDCCAPGDFYLTVVEHDELCPNVPGQGPVLAPGTYTLGPNGINAPCVDAFRLDDNNSGILLIEADNISLSSTGGSVLFVNDNGSNTCLGIGIPDNSDGGSSTLTVTYCGQDYIWNFVHDCCPAPNNLLLGTGDETCPTMTSPQASLQPGIYTITDALGGSCENNLLFDDFGSGTLFLDAESISVNSTGGSTLVLSDDGTNTCGRLTIPDISDGGSTTLTVVFCGQEYSWTFAHDCLCNGAPSSIRLERQTGTYSSNMSGSKSLMDLDNTDGNICSGSHTWSTNVFPGDLDPGVDYTVSVNGDINLLSSPNQTMGSDNILVEFTNLNCGSSTISIEVCDGNGFKTYTFMTFVHDCGPEFTMDARNGCSPFIIPQTDVYCEGDYEIFFGEFYGCPDNPFNHTISSNVNIINWNVSYSNCLNVNIVSSTSSEVYFEYSYPSNNSGCIDFSCITNITPPFNAFRIEATDDCGNVYSLGILTHDHSCDEQPANLGLDDDGNRLESELSHNLSNLQNVCPTDGSSTSTWFSEVFAADIPNGEPYSVSVSGDVTLLSNTNQTSGNSDEVILNFQNLESGSSTVTIFYCGQNYVWNFMHDCCPAPLNPLLTFGGESCPTYTDPNHLLSAGNYDMTDIYRGDICNLISFDDGPNPGFLASADYVILMTSMSTSYLDTFSSIFEATCGLFNFNEIATDGGLSTIIVGYGCQEFQWSLNHDCCDCVVQMDYIDCNNLEIQFSGSDCSSYEAELTINHAYSNDVFVESVPTSSTVFNFDPSIDGVYQLSYEDPTGDCGNTNPIFNANVKPCECEVFHAPDPLYSSQQIFVDQGSSSCRISMLNEIDFVCEYCCENQFFGKIHFTVNVFVNDVFQREVDKQDNLTCGEINEMDYSNPFDVCSYLNVGDVIRFEVSNISIVANPNVSFNCGLEHFMPDTSPFSLSYVFTAQDALDCGC